MDKSNVFALFQIIKNTIENNLNAKRHTHIQVISKVVNINFLIILLFIKFIFLAKFGGKIVSDTLSLVVYGSYEIWREKW